MNVFGHHIVILNDEQHAILKSAMADAGHAVVSAQVSEVATLWAEAKTKFPAIVSAVQTGIADLKDSSLSGGDKAVKVATDVLAVAPAVLSELPNAKDFFVHGVTEEFAVMEEALKNAAAGLIGKL